MGVEFGVTVSKGYLLMVIKCELLRTAIELREKVTGMWRKLHNEHLV